MTWFFVVDWVDNEKRRIEREENRKSCCVRQQKEEPVTTKEELREVTNEDERSRIDTLRGRLTGNQEKGEIGVTVPLSCLNLWEAYGY